MAPQQSLDLYRAQQRRIVATLGLVRREWAGMGDEFDASWASIGPRVTVLTSAAQLGAARDGAAYVEAVVGGAEHEVIPSALSGVASDGRPLASLLDSAVVEAKRGVEGGATAREALERGGRHLDMLVHTQVADAARDASSLAVTARPGVLWVRMVNPPCCQRCAVLAGKVFGYNEGFKRHPRCDCIHIPQRVGNPNTTGLVIGPEDVTDLTVGQRKAIADGADFNKTVNDRQRRRGDYLPRTRVDRITRAAPSQAEAIDALTRAGYLQPNTAARTVIGREHLESVVGKLVGATDEMDASRLELAASVLDDLTARYGVPVNRLEIGNTAKVGKFAAAGDAGPGGDVNIIAKAFGDKWQAWDRVGKKQGGVATVPTPLTNLEDVLIHEYGHLVDFYTDQKLSVTRLAKTLARDLGISQSDYDFWLTRQRSLYAKRSREETIAEAFLDVEANGENAAELSKRIHAELLRLLRAKRST